MRGHPFSNDKSLWVLASIRLLALASRAAHICRLSALHFAIECHSSFDQERIGSRVIFLLVGASAMTFVIRIMS